MYKGFLSPHPCQNLLSVVFLTIFILTDVRSWFAFIQWVAKLNIFSCACRQPIYIWKNVYPGLLLIFQLGFFFFFFYVELYQLLTYFGFNPYQSYIFHHSVGCLLILLMVSFAVQKLFSSLRSPLFNFAFVSFALGDRKKKNAIIYVKECSAYVFFY